MSPSSSGSWSGGRGADIIDLDRYMRGAVRPSRAPQPADPDPEPDRTDCELVVDAGGVKSRHKRFSHDSGVSDSSYSRHRRHSRPNRRTSTEGQRTRLLPAEPTPMRAADSAGSLRAFRAVCEQALLEQQRQIAHVAQLCERLTERAEKTERSDKPERSDQPERNDQTERSEATERCEQKLRSAEQKEVRSNASEHKERRSCEERPKSVTSRRTRLASTADLPILSSSTSRSTKDASRKDRHRTQQCKTYKIIMSKLDELNRLFATRAPGAGAGAGGGRGAPRRALPSSSSVTVCDKLVATEPLGDHTQERLIAPTKILQLQDRPCSPRPCSPASRRITHVYSVDIAPPPGVLPTPTPRTRTPNVVTQSVVKYETETEGGSTSGGDPRCNFDLEDPIHLYAQAKKLQTLTATTGCGRVRTRSADPVARVSSRGEEHTHSHPHSRSPSLCAACRDYWRSLRQCLLPNLFPQPDHCKC